MQFEKGIIPDDPTTLTISRLVQQKAHEAYKEAWKSSP